MSWGPEKRSGAGSEPSRQSLKRIVFRLCDRDRDGALNSSEMRQLALLSGFQGTEESWEEEYNLLCREYRIAPFAGIPERHVSALLDDESDRGIFFTTEELAEIAAQARPGEPESLEAEPAAAKGSASAPVPAAGEPDVAKEEEGTGRSRLELKRCVFRKCDEDGDGILCKREMRVLASFLGFQGDENEWAEEYPKVCSDFGADPRVGMPMAAVMDMLDDESPDGAYLNDRELEAIANIKEEDSPAPDAGCAVPVALLAEQVGGSSASGGPVNVFFAGASPDTAEQTLRQAFEAVGRVLSFELTRNSHGQSQGIGRVEFESEEEAEAAMRKLDRKDVEGRTLLLKRGGVPKHQEYMPQEQYGKKGRGRPPGSWQHHEKGGGGGKGKGGKASGKNSAACQILPGMHRREGRSVWFRGVSAETPSTYLQQIFSEAGRITSFQLFPKESKMRCRGVVTYQTAQEAQRSIEMLMGTMVDGHELLMEEDHIKGQESTPSHVLEAMSPQATASQAAPPALPPHVPPALPRTHEAAPPPIGAKGFRGKRCRDWGEEPPPQKARNGEETTVVFSGAPADTDEWELRQHFEEAGGPVEECWLYSSAHGRSKGMGRCRFRKAKDANRILRAGLVYNGYTLHLETWDPSAPSTETASAPSMPPPPPSWRVKAETASEGKRPNPSLSFMEVADDPRNAVFFMNVPLELGNRLRSLFRSTGVVKKITVYGDARNESRGMGMVEYTTAEAAQNACSRLHKKEVEGEAITVHPHPGATRLGAGASHTGGRT